MNPAEFTAGLVLLLVLAGISLYFSWQQVRVLRELPDRRDVTSEERSHLRGQAWRRLWCCVLMLVLAGMLAGSYFLESERLQIVEGMRQHKQRDSEDVLRAEQRDFLQRFTSYWIATLLLLMVFLLLAAVDVGAVLRHGIRQHRQLREQHHALLEMQARKFRERNGQG